MRTKTERFIMSKSKQFCSVFGCNSTPNKHADISLHSFPKEGTRKISITNTFGNKEQIDLRKAWILKLKMGKEVTRWMKVCSKHFNNNDYILPGCPTKKRRLKRDAVPSMNLPSLPQRGSLYKSPTKCSQLAARRLIRTSRRTQLIKKHTCKSSNNNLDDMQAANILLELHSSLSEQTQEENENFSIFSYSSKDASVQVKSGDISVPFCSIIDTEKKLNTLTGIPSFSLLHCLCDSLSEIVKDQKIHRLNINERVILTFMKMKLNISFTLLSILFGNISATTCKSIFVQTVVCLSVLLKCAIPWPSDSELKNNIPNCFNEFNDVRVVLDCTEIFIEAPKCVLCKLKFYSHYKSGLTIKVMIGVTPAGLISFVSEVYGGRASDKTVFEQSGILEKLKKNDAIMVDKGFLVDELCSRKGINLIRPPFFRNKLQFSKSEALLCRKVASARVHVERTIQRLKIFKILTNKYPTCLLSVVNEIFIVICGITNLSSPILGDDKF